MTEFFLTMFATFVAFVAGVVSITEVFNKVFKIQNQRCKLIASWVISIVLACVGFLLQAGIFAELGSIDQWQGWVKTVLIGLGCALSANKIYDRDEIWKLLEFIFSFFKKDGKEIRKSLNDR